MKKKLEAELISIAHRILKLKNKSEVDQLHRETALLLEKLSVLRFVEGHFADLRPTIGKAEAEEAMENAFTDADPILADGKEEKPEPKPEPQPDDKPAEAPVETPQDPGPEPEAPEIREPEIKEPEKLEAVETVSHLNDAPAPEQIVAEAEPSQPASEQTESAQPETIESGAAQPDTAEPEKPRLEDELFKPAFELSFERKEEPKTDAPAKPAQIAFDDLLGSGYKDPVFVKPEDLAREAASHVPPAPEVIPITRADEKVPVYKMSNTEIADRTVSLNDRLSKGITVGLNDRIAFVQHLFANSNEDYNRVLSQLITFNTYEEAVDFIENMVKPDYNNWTGKDEYAARFMEVVEKKFA